MASYLLVSLETIETLLSITLTVSGFLIATASFITGLYLSELKTFPPKKKTKPFIYLIISLIVLPIVIAISNSIAIVFSDLAFWLKLYLFLINLASIAPIAVIVYILRRKQGDGA